MPFAMGDMGQRPSPLDCRSAAAAADSKGPSALPVPPPLALAPPTALEGDAAARLHAACMNDDLDAAEALLKEAGSGAVALVNAPGPDGRTPLHVVASFCGFDIDTAAFVHLLCEWGADPSARDAAGQTPLMLAVREVGYGWHSPEATATLLAHGADPRAADAEGRTPLHHVGAGAADGCLYSPGEGPSLFEDVLKIRRIIRQLKTAGADTAAKDSAGRTPMQVAIANSNACMALALLMERVAAEQPLPPLLAARMGEVMRGAQARNVPADEAVSVAQAEVEALHARVETLEAEQLANMGPALRSLIVGVAAEARRLERARMMMLSQRGAASIAAASASAAAAAAAAAAGGPCVTSARGHAGTSAVAATTAAGAAPAAPAPGTAQAVPPKAGPSAAAEAAATEVILEAAAGAALPVQSAAATTELQGTASSGF